MKRVLPQAITEDATPVLVFKATRHRLTELFPVRFSAVDSFAEPEPSEAALIELKSGQFVVVTIGTITNRVTISVPVSADARQTIRGLLEEASIRKEDLVWTVNAAIRKEVEASRARKGVA